MVQAASETEPTAAQLNLGQRRGSPAVAVRGLTKSFGESQALKGVSLDILQGEFFSLLGPSGCGKTTLLRIIGGFEAPTAGHVEIDGRDAVGDPPYARSTNMIFQNLALFPHLSVFENVAFSLRLRKQPKAAVTKKVEEALSLVRLMGYGARKIDQLSGGQRQRVALARALVNEPSVLLLDEPLGALDLQLRLQMQEELRRIQRTLGNTFIFVTHDQGEAMSMSDRIAIMNEGEVVQVGSPEAIYDRPETRFVANFVGHANLLDGVVVEQNGDSTKFDCGGIVFVVDSRVRVNIGQHVSAALRFERLILVNAPEGVRGTVLERSFLGGMVRLTVRTDIGPILRADLSTSGPFAIPDVDAVIHIGWRPTDVRLLTR
jgi:spermidine/putrescine ABC transporter ATP-binding subunit